MTHHCQRARVLEALRQAKRERRNFGSNPLNLPPDAPAFGWVSGAYFIFQLRIGRHGSRLHELREAGYVIETHMETIEGARHSFYRLRREPNEQLALFHPRLFETSGGARR